MGNRLFREVLKLLATLFSILFILLITIDPVIAGGIAGAVTLTVLYFGACWYCDTHGIGLPPGGE